MSIDQVDDDDGSLPPDRLCFVSKDFSTPFSCSMARIYGMKDEEDAHTRTAFFSFLDEPDLEGHRSREE